MGSFGRHRRRWGSTATSRRRAHSRRDGHSQPIEASPLSGEPHWLQSLWGAAGTLFEQCMGAAKPRKPHIQPIYEPLKQSHRDSSTDSTSPSDGDKNMYASLPPPLIVFNESVELGLVPSRNELFCQEDSWFSPKVSKRRCFYTDGELKLMRWVEKNRCDIEKNREAKEQAAMGLHDVNVEER